ncbi:MAG: alpha/beta fold hydrolase [Pseudomonadota bacterium]
MTTLRLLCAGPVALVLAILIALPVWGQVQGPVLPERVLPRIDVVHPAWATFEPRFQETVCPFTGRESYDRAVFRCGYVLVPEDRTRRTSRLIKLSVVQAKAMGGGEDGGETDAGAEPPAGIVFLSGGPGGPSLGRFRLSRHKAGYYDRLRRHADLIWFDQRGVGYSGGDFCRALPQPYQFGLPADAASARFAAELERCFEEARAQGIAVEGYSNWQNALDVRDIRRALGYEQWNVFGISYGTELAQGVMQVDPEGTRAVVLDSVVPAGYATNDLGGMYAAGFRSALTAIDAMCAADTACEDAFPEGSLSTRFVAAFEAYEAEPLEIGGLPPHASATGSLVVDGTVAAGAVFQALYSRDVYGSLPALLEVLETRNSGALKAYVETLGYPLDHRYGMGMSAAINCRAGFRKSPEAPPPHGEPEPVLAPLMGTLSRDTVCEGFYSSAPDPTVTPAISDIPTLVAMGRVDPITPPYYADVVMPRLTAGQRVDVAYTGHGALLSHWQGCGEAVTRDFFLAPTERVDTGCLDAVTAPDMLVDLRRTDAPYQFGLGLQAGQYPWAAILPAGFLVLLLAAFPLGALARRFDGTHSGDYGRARLLTVLGGAASLTGLALAVRTILNTATSHAATLPVGVPASIATGGWFAAAGALLGGLALVALARSSGTRHRTVGTAIAITLGALATFAILWFLFSVDAGPFMV